jgi:RNA polymerase sigma-70 factor (ECF subfamily)
MLESATRTTTLLLDDLRDSDNAPAWEEFDSRYRPIVAGMARRLGLTEHDAADAAQETMVRFLREYRAGKYDRTRGRLRAWVAVIARSCIADLRRARARVRVARGESAMPDLPASEEMERMWDEELRETLLRRADEALRKDTRLDEKTIRAFELLAVKGLGVKEAAEELGMTVESVYKARSRCLKQLRAIVEELTAAYEAA